MKQTKKNNAGVGAAPLGWLHGECVLRQATLPEDAQQLSLTDLKRVSVTDGVAAIIADSETTGNHHVVMLDDTVKFFEKAGTRFVTSRETIKVRCVLKERHDEMVLPAGTYQIGFQQEYDYLTQSLRNVRD